MTARKAGKEKTAKEWVALWQTARAHTQAELRAKLETKTFSEAAITQALAWATEYAGQSDNTAAKDLVLSRRRQRYGAARIAAELEKRGIHAAEQFAAASDVEELARAETALAASTQKEPMKAAQWLLRRGFAEEIARRAVEKKIGRLEE